MMSAFQEFGYSRIFDGSSAEELAKESQLGNMYVRGYDKTGRPALYFKPGGAGFNAEPAGVKYLVYCVERVPSLHRRCFRALQVHGAPVTISTHISLWHQGHCMRGKAGQDWAARPSSG